MVTTLSNSIATATKDFGEAPSSFELGMEVSVDSTGQHVFELSLFRRGLNLVAVVGQALMIIAGPLALLLSLTDNLLLAIVLPIVVLGFGIIIRLSHRKLFRIPGRSKTFSVRTIPTLSQSP